MNYIQLFLNKISVSEWLFYIKILIFKSFKIFINVLRNWLQLWLFSYIITFINKFIITFCKKIPTYSLTTSYMAYLTYKELSFLNSLWRVNVLLICNFKLFFRDGTNFKFELFEHQIIRFVPSLVFLKII